MIEVKIKWIETLIKKTNVKLLLTWIKSWMNKSLKIVHWQAIRETPIDTGNLRKWYRERFRWLRGKVLNKVKYAKAVNEGTGNRRANPFLKRTKDKTEDKVNRIFNSEIEKTLWLLN